MSQYDVVVIGAGLAGLTTACQLAQADQKVLLVANGVGALVLASGCIDVLGFHPADSRAPIQNPAATLDDFLTTRPDHPYNFVGKQQLERGLNQFLQLIEGELNYQGAFDRNWLLPTPAGAVHPTCLAPASLANGELSQGGRMLIVGFRELRDFYPSLISQNLKAQDVGVQSAALTVELPSPLTGKMNVTPLELAHAFEQLDFRRRLIQKIESAGKGYSRIGFPAVLGIGRHSEVLADIQTRLGKTVFEISALPPSVPGRRLFEHLRQIFTEAKGRLIIGGKVVDGHLEGERVTQIRFETASRLRTIRADYFVLASGGLFGGGIQTDAEGRVWEPIFDLPVIADKDRHKWFAKHFVSPTGQPVAHYGIKVNQRLNPVNDDGSPVANNLFVAGATLAGSDWTRGRTGDGVAVATAAKIADQIGQG